MPEESDDVPLRTMTGPAGVGAEPDAGVAVDLGAPAWTGALDDAEAVCRRAVAAARAEAEVPAGEVSIVLADDAFIRALNRTHRGKDRATDVLAFPQIEAGADASAGGPALLGDVVVAYETAARDAAAADKRLGDHLAHLIVHGVLHLAGHDHENDREAAAMEALERAALARLGIADPYVDTVGAATAPAAE